MMELLLIYIKIYNYHYGEYFNCISSGSLSFLLTFVGDFKRIAITYLSTQKIILFLHNFSVR